MSKLPLHLEKNLYFFEKIYILYKMSFVSKECLDKKVVTIIIGIITELRLQLSFLRRVKFLLLWNRKTMSVRKNFPANAHPKLQVISKYIQIHNKVTQRSTENSPLSRILSTGTNNSNIFMSCSHFSQHGSFTLRAAFSFYHTVWIFLFHYLFPTPLQVKQIAPTRAPLELADRYQ